MVGQMGGVEDVEVDTERVVLLDLVELRVALLRRNLDLLTVC